jgi:hydrogenase nickel incorporation protein HypB
VLITKTDLLPYLPVDIERIENHIRQVNPRCTVLRVSASSGEGLDAWHAWIREQIGVQQSAHAHHVVPQLVNA